MYVCRASFALEYVDVYIQNILETCQCTEKSADYSWSWRLAWWRNVIQ